MTTEQGGTQPEKQQRPAIELRVWPSEDESVVFERQADGRFRLSLTGRVDIIFPAPNSLKSPVRADFDESGTQIPDGTPEARIAQSSSATEDEKKQEGNQKFVFVGNPVRDPAFWVTKRGKRVADFILATHLEEGETEYRKIRAFNDLAERVRDQVKKGQTGVEATVYGPKHWKSRRKTSNGWEEKEVTGYYAGFVKVPKRYR